jgi:hypothetical protein
VVVQNYYIEYSEDVLEFWDFSPSTLRYYNSWRLLVSTGQMDTRALIGWPISRLSEPVRFKGSVLKMFRLPGMVIRWFRARLGANVVP